jgi:single-stranded-DNA-specific exonuclease
LLVEVLTKMGAQVEPYIPNRFDEGYGLNNEALDNLYQKGTRLVITVDCGARSPDEAMHARSIGLDLIISDHHLPGPEPLSNVVAFINPRKKYDRYPDEGLVGVGLAYKIATALLELYPIEGVNSADWLDLVALGTVADMAPLKGENRELVANGLRRIHAQKRQGINSLIRVAGKNPTRITATDIGFILGPRLNAAGRLESAQDAVRLLMTDDEHEAGLLAQKLDNQNDERQRIMREIQEKATAMAIMEDPKTPIIIAVDPDFNEGIVGLAAARLVEAFYRPAIVGRIGSEATRASCRSIPEFDITAALDQCKDLLIKHGGHKAAAGFTVANDNLPRLAARLRQIASQKFVIEELSPVIEADLDAPLYYLAGKNTPSLFSDLGRIQPTGYGNPEPVFISRNLLVKNYRKIGRDNKHLRMTVVDEAGVSYGAVAFQQGHWADQPLKRVDLIYTFEKNEYQGREDTQLNVKDMKLSVQD